MAEPAKPLTMDTIVSLCRRRGFVFPSSEIYGGLGSTYDYGHYGVLTKNNIRALWFRAMVQERDDIVALDSAVILNPSVWEASGHVAGFTDPLVDCRTCKLRFRADQLEQASCGRRPSKRPGETPDCDLTEPRQFNLMFETHVGALQDESSTAYLRPETAQGIFVNFKNVAQLARRKPPFGIAQVGKSFRNEITPGNFLFRMREFEQMEMEFFVPEAEADHWYHEWIRLRRQWYLDLGMRESHLRVRPHDADELSHYSSGTSGLEYRFAPVKVAVLPLVGKDEGLVGKARPLYEELRKVMPAEYDDSASIGKRYRRQDEIGTPWAVTIDHDTLEDGQVTIRDRDTLEQE